MRASDTLSVGIFPSLALVAAILYGGAQRPPEATPGTPPRESPAAAATAAEPDSADLADVRPVMELMAESLGVNAEHGRPRKLATALEGELNTPHEWWAVQGDDSAAHAARIAHARDARRADDDALLKALVAAAGANSCRSAEVPANAPSAGGFDVRFLIATIPDYVDSYGGWAADSILSGIQAAMSHEHYTLERFRLIDWTRADPASSNPTATNSRLHERQPGALIFRQVDTDARTGDGAAGTRLYVVLLVLETATAGVHATSLTHAAGFVQSWMAESRCSRPLHVVGPTYSGSITSLARTLSRARHLPTIVISGSANADDNQARFHAAFREGIYATTQQRTTALFDETRRLLAARGFNPERTALLIESSTTYGDEAAKTNAEFARWTFRFPLHVSQLRGQTRTAPTPTIALTPSTLVPLNLRETTPPTDQIPALRPATTSPSIESTLSVIFDTIRHENIHALGIVATDVRDVLFLSRELKRAAPNVQLVLFGGHSLFLHPEYSPYMRGALVASSYSLSLHVQAPGARNPGLRMAFESMSAAGVFNAVVAQLSLGGSDVEPDPSQSLKVTGAQLLDYCLPDSDRTGCRAPVWLSVIGADGYWPLESRQVPDVGEMLRLQGTSPSPEGRTPVPTPGALLALLLFAAGGLFVGSLALEAAATRATGMFDRARGLGGLVPSPLVSIVTPPGTYMAGRRLHGVALFVLTCLFALFLAWMLAVLAVHLGIGNGSPGLRQAIVVAITCAVIGLGVLAATAGLGCDAALQVSRKAPFTLSGGAVMTISLLLTGVALAALAAWTWDAYLAPVDAAAQGRATLAAVRTLGGGVVSAGSVVVSLTAALAIPLLWTLRRLSLVGRGYTEFTAGSATFRLLSDGAVCRTEPATPPSDLVRLAHTIDMPIHQLGRKYVAGLVLVLIAVLVGLGGNTPTLEDPWFAIFLGAGSLSAATSSLLLVAQAGRTWWLLQPALEELARTPLGCVFKRVDSTSIKWTLSLAHPRLLSDLAPAVALARQLRYELAGLASHKGGMPLRESHPQPPDPAAVLGPVARTLQARTGETADLSRVLTEDYAGTLAAELDPHGRCPSLLQSTTFEKLWRLSDALVLALQRVRWSRNGRDNGGAALAAMTNGAGDHKGLQAWFDRSELLVAMLLAFVFRDILSRIVSALFAAMLTLSLVTAAHLFYVFQARWSYLVLDMLLLALVSAVAVWILVAVERNHVISLLRHSRPGRVDFNWEFVRRVTLYGLLPLAAVLGALFPEVGESIFGWLEPFRKLVSL